MACPRRYFYRVPWILGTLLSIVLAYVGLCLLAYLFQERFIFIRFPRREQYRFGFQQPFREVWLQREGARLHALCFTAEGSKGTILYFHGNTGDLKRWGRKAARFTQLGYDVLMPDPRGYGKSRGHTSEAALIADAIAWYDHLAAQVTSERIVLYGRSLGAALAVPVAAQRTPRMLVLETPFAKLADVTSHYFPVLPYRWLLRYPFRNDQAVREVRCPVYIFHGERDPVVPYASALKLYAAIPSHVHRELFSFPNGLHNDLYKYDRFRELMQRVLAAGLGGNT